MLGRYRPPTLLPLFILQILGYGEGSSVISDQLTRLVSFGGLRGPGLGVFLGNGVEYGGFRGVGVDPIELGGLIGLVLDCADGVDHALVGPKQAIQVASV